MQCNAAQMRRPIFGCSIRRSTACATVTKRLHGQRRWLHTAPPLLWHSSIKPCRAVDASDPAGLEAAIESKLAESLDPDRLSISVQSPSSIRIEVAANSFDGLKVPERVSLVKELLVAEVDHNIADAAEIVAMTPREYFASLKRWC